MGPLWTGTIRPIQSSATGFGGAKGGRHSYGCCQLRQYDPFQTRAWARTHTSARTRLPPQQQLNLQGLHLFHCCTIHCCQTKLYSIRSTLDIPTKVDYALRVSNFYDIDSFAYCNNNLININNQGSNSQDVIQNFSKF